MNEKELRALITLLDDEDDVVYSEVSNRLLAMGERAIPHLEQAWEAGASPLMQQRIENLIHQVQLKSLQEDLYFWLEHEQDNLLKGLWLLARYAFPELSFEAIEQQFAQLYYDAWFRFQEGLHPLDQIQLLNRVFFKEWKFQGNTKDFHAPANSLINLVLERRKGNPLTLCVLYMSVAQRLNLPVYGVNMPVVFVLIYRAARTDYYINVFNQGSVFTRSDIEDYLHQLNVAPQTTFFEPCAHIDIVARAFRNLVYAYRENNELDKAVEVHQLLQLIEKYYR